MIVGRLGPFLGQRFAQVVVHHGVPPIASLPDGVFPADSPQVCAFELTISEIGKVEPRFSQVRSPEVGPVKRGFHEVRLHHGRSLKVALREIALGQIGPIKDGAAEVRASVPAFAKDRFRVVLKRIIDHNGLFGRCFVVPWVALSTARHDHAFTSSVGALVEVCLAFGCKDCESVLVVLSGGDPEEASLL